MRPTNKKKKRLDVFIKMTILRLNVWSDTERQDQKTKGDQSAKLRYNIIGEISAQHTCTVCIQCKDISNFCATFYISPLHFSDNFISDNNKFTHVWHSPLVPGPGNQELVLLLSSEPKKSNSYQAFPRTTWKLITCGEI